MTFIATMLVFLVGVAMGIMGTFLVAGNNPTHISKLHDKLDEIKRLLEG